MVNSGLFITFEGGEGCGKTTQISLLSESLTAHKIPHIVTREPGGTLLAERIRPLVVEASGTEEDWNPLAETLLFLAARIQHWQQKIQPALLAGQWVLCDRFIDSTLVYQGIAKGLGVEYLRGLHRYLCGQQWQPNITFLLDIDPEKGLKRAANRNNTENRFEDMNLSFHQQLREGFLLFAQQDAKRFRCINADDDVKSVHNNILKSIGLE